MRRGRTLTVLLTALSLLLTGCSALLEREYTQVAPHNTAPTAEGDPSTLRADSYQELVNALIYFVGAGTEEGTIRLYLDSEQVEDDLEAACLEVVQEDPLGAYAVEFIKYSVSQVVAYTQADVQITYRRTREQVSSIVQATGTTAIRGELESALSSFSPACTLRISYFDGDEELIRTLARQAYYAAPASALGMPELEITLYPDSGRQRIVEILLSYPLELSVLEQRRGELEQQLAQLSAPLMGLEEKDLALAAAQTVLGAGSYDPDGANTAYDLLEGGAANSEGFALALAALLERRDMSVQVAQGKLDGQEHFWVVVQTQEGWRHLDPTGFGGGPGALYTDSELAQLGYSWDQGTLPVCSAAGQ